MESNSNNFRIYKSLRSAQVAENRRSRLELEQDSHAYWIRFQSTEDYIFEVMGTLFEESEVIQRMRTDLNLEVTPGRLLRSGRRTMMFINEEPIAIPFPAAEFQTVLQVLINMVQRTRPLFTREITPEHLMIIMKIANYFEMSQLFKAAVAHLEQLMKSTSTLEEMRKLLNIKNDFSFEENRQIIEENLGRNEDTNTIVVDLTDE